MILVFKNYELKAFGDFLYELALKGKDSRMRSRFIGILEAQLQLIATERDILLQDYAKKDENDEPIRDKDEKGQEFVILEDSLSFNMEVSKLMNEEFIIEVKNEKVEMIKTIQRIVLEVDEEFSGIEAERYNRFCDILETVSFEEMQQK
ncbi:hypothetical protein B1B04_09150 [Lysinibacillus sp. KCTC 33748]|uniref:hypothetical protein n=1 Tax=unclassified Lysinibacillus TaxID=2636778 RepID=UPI0009A88A79|nr:MULTISPECIES: hypothetical protein [unclassified Lysinibacillus]OXS74283.1 hypothetical protein B1B04_09150 [Lysinibacillus sp. KCTC 33748]SKB63626.1 hypothetical protein SAMN06295926_10511 [Lysinibacillus sp. AC-3]